MSRSGSGCWQHVKIAAAAALLGSFFLDQDPSGIGAVTVCASAVAFLLVQLLLRNLMRRGGITLLVSTGSYCRRDFLRQPWVLPGIVHAFTSLTLLGSLLSLLTALRLLPDLLKYADGEAFQAQLLEGFPADVELLVVNQTLRVRGPPGREEGEVADLRVGLSHMLLEVCGGAYHEMGRDVSNLGVADLHLLGHFLLDRGLLSPLAARIGGLAGAAAGTFRGDPYVRVTEFEVGEEVEVRVGEELFGCGLPRHFLPAPVAGLWRPGVIEEVQASTKMQDFHYIVRLEADTTDVAVGLECKIWAPNLRRRRLSVLFRLGEHRAPAVGSELQAAKAVLVFEETRFAILEGYSFQHRSHWQYVVGDDKDESKRNRASIWHNYTRGEINSYFPLSCAAGLFCREVAAGGEVEGPAGDSGDLLLCSREVGREKVEGLLRQERALNFLLRSSLHAPLLLGLLWVSSVLATLGCRFLIIALVYTPIAYIACGLLRHVDTPLVPMCKIFGLVLYSSTIPTWLFRLTNCVWKVWGTDDFLHPLLQSPTEWVTLHPFLLMSFWAIWNAYLVIQMREHITSLEHQRRCPPPPSAAGSGRPPQPQPAPAVGGGEDDNENSEPMCRICFGGREAGRLISPCLCSGTMRFVHTDCLTVWRLGSANPMSSYQCDQCKYRYSFRRTLSAKILRSAIVLHALTLAAFAMVVLLGAMLCLFLEQWLKAPTAVSLVSDELVQKLANDTDLSPEVVREQLTELANASWHGLHLAHLIWGFALVGYSGFISLGFYWFPDLLRGDRGVEVPFVLLLGSLIGSIRVMVGLYSYFKDASGWLLQSVENLIIEVGSGDTDAAKAHYRTATTTAGPAANLPPPRPPPPPPQPSPAGAGPPPPSSGSEVGGEDVGGGEDENEGSSAPASRDGRHESCSCNDGCSEGGLEVERLEDERGNEGEGEFDRVGPGGAAEPDLVLVNNGRGP